MKLLKTSLLCSMLAAAAATASASELAPGEPGPAFALGSQAGRPVDLKDALRRSAGVTATVHQLRPDAGKKPRRK